MICLCQYENKALTRSSNVRETKTMITQIRQVLTASDGSLVQDFAGVLAIGAMTLGALHLPGFI